MKIEFRAVFIGETRADPSEFSYDALGRQIVTINPDNTRADLIYEPRRVTSIDGNRNPKIFNRDAYGRVISVQEANGSVTSYDYDAADSLTKVTNTSATRPRSFTIWSAGSAR